MRSRPRPEPADWPGIRPAIDHDPMTLVGDAFSPAHEPFFPNLRCILPRF
ncbi:MAG: hypothetical protein AB2693_08605 [Candidatus Thiodiazotropha sp.]